MNACSSCAVNLDSGAPVCMRCGAAAPPEVPACRTERQDEPPALFSETLFDSDRHLEGLSGWLIFMGISLVVAPFSILVGMAKNIPLVVEQRYQPFLESHPALHGLILFEIATNLIFVAILAALNYLFFRKKRSFPTYMVLYLSVHAVVLLADTLGAHAILHSRMSAESAGEIVRTVVSSGIWIPYLFLSRRVKATFVH